MNHLFQYEKIINNAKKENRKRYKKDDSRYIYYEQHHINPVCLNGSNDKQNLVLLTAKEHFICHKLLVFIYPGNKKLVYALNRMTYSKRYDRYLSSRDYESIKTLMAITPISEETRKKQSEAKKGDKNPNKKGLSKEHIEKIRQSNIGWKHTKETIKRLKIIQSKPRPYRRANYKLTSPDGEVFEIETRKELYKFIAENHLSQRRITSCINKGVITEKDFKIVTKDSKKTLGWKIEKKN